MYGIKAKEIHDRLIADGIKDSTGSIRFELMNITLDIEDKSAMGTLIQEWLGTWMNARKIYHRTQENSQVFPDFFLEENDLNGLLEVKSFDYTTSPNFDIANFDTYTRSISEAAYRLDADYLIFGYELIGTKLTIKDIWIKKVWELTCGSVKYPVRTQVKQHVIHNIRPYNFKNNSKGFQAFATRRAFVEALRETIRIYTPERGADEWFKSVEESYSHFLPKSLL